MARVVLAGVSRDYPQGVRAVERLDLDVHDQELLVLVGPSGCGKTTTLRLIAGLESLTSGEVHIGGRCVNHLPPKDRDVAMVFQNHALYPHLSIYKNLAFGLGLRHGGWLRKSWQRLTNQRPADDTEPHDLQIDRRVREAARLLGIEGLLERMPHSLSGGERQRVALGRAIVRQPAVFLLDEPLSDLDAKLRGEMRRELKHLHRRLQTTMIYVTHDQVEALTLGDRIAVMAEGRLQQVGPPLEVYDQPANCFVAGFIGTPAMNLLPGRITIEDGKLWRFTGSGWSVPLSQSLGPAIPQPATGSFLLGIRPEDVRRAGSWTTDDAPSALLMGEVSLIESTGDATIVQLVNLSQPGVPAETPVEDLAILCKLEARTALNLGDRVPIVFNMDRAHVFDAASGANLALAGNVKGN